MATPFLRFLVKIPGPGIPRRAPTSPPNWQRNLLMTSFLALVITTNNCCAQAPGDKVLHFFVSAGIAGTASTITDNFAAGFAAGLVPGIAKEMWDDNHGSRFDHEDLLADIAGCLVGAAIGKNLHIALYREKVNIVMTLTVP